MSTCVCMCVLCVHMYSLLVHTAFPCKKKHTWKNKHTAINEVVHVFTAPRCVQCIVSPDYLEVLNFCTTNVVSAVFTHSAMVMHPFSSSNSFHYMISPILIYTIAFLWETLITISTLPFLLFPHRKMNSTNFTSVTPSS